jgi:hypothetical protein
MGSRIRGRAAGGLATLAVLGAVGFGPATGVDTTPPSLTVPAAASFVVGTQIGDSTGPNGLTPETYPILQRVSWRASDASGICGYDVTETYAGTDPVVLLSNTRQRSFQRATTDYDDQQGGGSFKAESWVITASDCAGNSTSRETIIRPVVTQENGWTYGYLGVLLRYTGSWSTSNCQCWSGDHTRYATAAGGRASISRTWAAGDYVALVMEKAPNRGRFTVDVDGSRRATVDTFAATPTHRSVVWDTRLPAGAHTVSVINAGTPGRPRIDLDAVLSNSQNYG